MKNRELRGIITPTSDANGATAVTEREPVKRGVSDHGKMPGERTHGGHMPGEAAIGMKTSAAVMPKLIAPDRDMPGKTSGKEPGGIPKITKKLHIYAPADTVEAAAAGAMLVSDTPGGSTANFQVNYDSALGSDGPTIANSILAVCEADYFTLRGYFNMITPGSLPFQIHITTGSNGASHATCAATSMNIGAHSGPGVDIPFMRQLVIAEEDEVFEAAIGRGWDCGASNGEGLSRVLANAMYPGAEPSNFVTAPSWLDSNRPDWVTKNDPTAGTGGGFNAVSIGCAVLFLNWLRY